MENYVVQHRIGEGAHGIVLKAKCLQDGKTVALKKISLKKLDDGLNCRHIREIKSLQELKHINIIRLREVFPHCCGFVLVFDHMPLSLQSLVKLHKPLLESRVIKAYLSQILSGTDYMHKIGIIHRDIKPANLLISKRGIIQIADFGLARLHFRNLCRPYTPQVATRWYRAPELLYGAKYYDEAVDLWAIGCVFGEMIKGEPLFQGDNDIEQIVCVFQALGTPTEEIWPGLTNLPDYGKITFAEYPVSPVATLIPSASANTLNLLQSFLIYNPAERIRTDGALNHGYFGQSPKLATNEDLARLAKMAMAKASIIID